MAAHTVCLRDRACCLKSTVGMSGAADDPASREQAELADDPRHIVKWFVDASQYHDQPRELHAHMAQATACFVLASNITSTQWSQH